MLFVDPAQPDLVVSFVMFDDEATVFLAESLESAGELHVILTIRGFDRDRAVARRIFDLDRRRELAAAKPLASLDRVDLGDRNDISVAGFADLLRLFALDLEHGPDARVIAVVGFHV